MTTSWTLGLGEARRRPWPRRPGRRRRCPARARRPRRRPARPRPSAGRRRWAAAGRRRRAAACGPRRAGAARACRPASSCPRPADPASRMTVGGVLAKPQPRVSPPRIATSSSWTILTTCCAGFSAAGDLRAERALLDPGGELRTTGRATSASSSAVRISRTVASTSASDSRPLPRRPLKVAARRSEREVNSRTRVGQRNRPRRRHGWPQGLPATVSRSGNPARPPRLPGP